MGYVSNPAGAPGGPERDDADHAKLRHGRSTEVGNLPGRFLMPAPLLFTRDGHNVFLGDMFRGGSCFLVCSGPSLKAQDLTLLQQRGIVTCTVNNAATVVRSSLWVSVDDPGNFSDAVWRDPAITKLVPLDHMEKAFTVRNSSGELEQSRELVGDMPAVFGFRRNEAFNASQFLYEDTVNWGNHGQRVDELGIKGSRSVMLAAVRLMFYLGMRTLYLLGCDFKMQQGVANYAFPQDRSRSSVNGNNKTFDALNARFRSLLPSFERENFQIFNCTPDSGLTAFPTMRYEEAVEAALTDFPRQINTAGMYDRKQRECDQGKPARASRTSAAVDRPSLTLFTTVDANESELLVETWKTWMRFHPWLKTVPVHVLCSSDVNRTKLQRKLRCDHSSVECSVWPLKASIPGREQWAETWLRFPAKRITTDWYLKLEPTAVATRTGNWLNPEWFRPQSSGGLPAFIAPRWGYSKPADVLTRLDDWADNLPPLKSFPRVNVPTSATDDRVRHDAISSWMFFGNTEWTRQIDAICTGDLPCASFDTFVTFCAARRRDPIIRWPMKDHGWEHTFGSPDKTLRICKRVVNASTSPS